MEIMTENQVYLLWLLFLSYVKNAKGVFCCASASTICSFNENCIMNALNVNGKQVEV